MSEGGSQAMSCGENSSDSPDNGSYDPPRPDFSRIWIRSECGFRLRYPLVPAPCSVKRPCRLPPGERLLRVAGTARNSQYIASTIRRADGKTVIEAALEQDAFQRRRQIAIGGNKRRDRISGRRGVHRREQFALRCNHLNTLSQRKNADEMP
jgi:hypothetical protein